MTQAKGITSLRFGTCNICGGMSTRWTRKCEPRTC